MKKADILLDCDGILSDFVTPALELVFNHTGDRHTVDEITQWDVFKAIGKKEHEHILDHAVCNGGFCASLPVMPGSQEAVEELRKLGDVYIVTSPYDAPAWVYERTKWLGKHFGFTKKQVINASPKFMVMGDVLVDDSGSNLIDWSAKMKSKKIHGLPILWDRPWNADVSHVDLRRVFDWNNAIECIKAHVEG